MLPAPSKRSRLLHALYSGLICGLRLMGLPESDVVSRLSGRVGRLGPRRSVGGAGDRSRSVTKRFLRPVSDESLALALYFGLGRPGVPFPLGFCLWILPVFKSYASLSRGANENLYLRSLRASFDLCLFVPEVLSLQYMLILKTPGSSRSCCLCFIPLIAGNCSVKLCCKMGSVGSPWVRCWYGT